MSLASEFLAFDDALAAHGVPPLAPLWRESISRFLDRYERDGVLEYWACAGRGSAKSTAVYKLITFFTLFGQFNVPSGERHFAVCLSRLKEEATKGIAIISAWLRVLGVDHRVAGDVIELAHQPRGIRVVAASVVAASGWRAFLIAADEFSKWATQGAEDLDADEVRSSAIAMTATHRNAPIITVGSAWGAFGSFHDAITGGSDGARETLGPIPTWEIAPHITKEETQRKERDPKRHAREYGCNFQGGISSAIDVDGLAECVRPIEYCDALAAPVVVIDQSGGRFDGYVANLVCWYREYASGPWHLVRDGVAVRGADGELVPDPNYRAERPVLHVQTIFYAKGPICQTMTTSDVATEIAKASRPYAIEVFGDQHAAWSWTSDFARHGMRYTAHHWDNPSKNDAITRLRQLIRERTLVIAPDEHAPPLLDEARRFVEKLTPSGLTTFSARTGADDRIMALAMMAYVDSTTGLRGSPIRQINTRHEVRR